MQLNFQYIIKIIVCFFVFHSVLVCKSQKKSWEQDCFKKIIETIGNKSLSEPKFKIEVNLGEIAKYNPNSKTIFIDQKLIDICKEFGKDSTNCLAFILSHELMHHYLEHGFLNRSIKKEYKEFSFMDNLKVLSRDSLKRLEMEAQSDLKGGFYTFLAGYNSLDIAPDLLDTLYKRYGLASNSKNYPSLEERKKIVYKQQEKLKRLKNIYQASTFSFIAEEYKFAIDGFEKIISEGFISKEIFNNLGLIFIKYAVSKMDHENLLGYPFEYDAKNRLNKPSTRSVNNFQFIENLLFEGSNYFDQALGLDPKYEIAHINKSSSYSVLAELYSKNEKERFNYIQKALISNNIICEFENNTDLEEFLVSKELIKKAFVKAKEDIKKLIKNKSKTVSESEINKIVLSAILLNQLGDTSKALKILTKAKKMGSTLAKLNYNKLSGESNALNNDNKTNTSIENEILDSFNPNKILYEIGEFEEPFEKYRFNKCKQYVKEFPNSTAHLIDKRKNFFVHYTNYLSTNSGVKIGDNPQILNEIFKVDPIIINGNSEIYLHYPENEIIFVVQNNKIKKWAIYRNEK